MFMWLINVQLNHHSPGKNLRIVRFWARCLIQTLLFTNWYQFNSIVIIQRLIAWNLALLTEDERWCDCNSSTNQCSAFPTSHDQNFLVLSCQLDRSSFSTSHISTRRRHDCFCVSMIKPLIRAAMVWYAKMVKTYMIIISAGNHQYR